jgi:hypothetical protein
MRAHDNAGRERVDQLVPLLEQPHAGRAQMFPLLSAAIAAHLAGAQLTV